MNINLKLLAAYSLKLKAKSYDDLLVRSSYDIQASAIEKYQTWLRLASTQINETELANWIEKKSVKNRSLIIKRDLAPRGALRSPYRKSLKKDAVLRP